MIINDSVLENSEKITFTLRALYKSHGYRHYTMSKFEEYDLYAGNKDFLVSDNVITFNDTDGKLLALKPDVTLSIIKNAEDIPSKTSKLFYNENVYRVSKGTGSFREIMQSGVECLGKIGMSEICESLTLAAESLSVVSDNYVVSVSDLDVLSDITERLDLKGDMLKELYSAISEKNVHTIDEICASCQDRDCVELLKKLITSGGKIQDVLPLFDELLCDCKPYFGFRQVMVNLENSDQKDFFRIDFSVISDINYYNGIVFKGFIKNIPSDVLSGGQYDRLMKKMGRKSGAVGFAVYTDAIERVKDEQDKKDNYINIALPKGRLGEKIYELFDKAGFECPSLLEPNRKLIFENAEKKLRYFWVKPSDVAIYVERGAADIGVAGKDILLEYEPEVFELLDLHKGICRMAVAAPKGYKDDASSTLRVATKFSNIAKKYYRSKGRDIDIIHLNGSIEIAPILGLSDVIVDIVETGTTLKENDLEVVETVVPISARLIANKSSAKFKKEQIELITNGLRNVSEENK